MNIESYLKESYPGIVLRDMRHQYLDKKKDKNMLDALRRYKECRELKPKSQIRHEISLCRKYWGCYPLHYYRYDLYRNDMQLSEQDLIDYIPDFFFYYFFLPFYDSQKYNILLSDKNIMECILRNSGIAQAPTIFKIVGGRLYSADMKTTSLSKIKKILMEKQYQKIFVKPVLGSGGFGIYIFNRDTNGVYATSNNERFDESFLNGISGNDYIAQAGLIQNAGLSAIFPKSVNTFRIVTENLEGKVRILGTVLRVGIGNHEFDNASQGGMAVKIDSETGKAGDFAITEMRKIYYKHPDTDYDFKDRYIPEWQKIRKYVMESAARLPHFTYLGWDTALTVDGPVIIEANLGFGLDVMQIPLGGLRKEFGIEEPRLYYRNRGKRA